jgi:MarR family 2-MHQ and catechol resistance regulon transcriptional repressor
MPQTQLCAKILRSGSNITTVVDNLERDGLVRRERQESDRRVQVVHLTDAGRKLIIRAFPSHVRRIADTFGVLSRDEQQELARLCRKLGLGQPPS